MKVKAMKLYEDDIEGEFDSLKIGDALAVKVNEMPEGVGNDPDFGFGELLDSPAAVEAAAAVLAGRVKVVQQHLVGQVSEPHSFWPLLTVEVGGSEFVVGKHVSGVRVTGGMLLPIREIVERMQRKTGGTGTVAWQAKLLAATGRLQGMADELRQVAEMEKFGAKAHQLRRVSAEVASYVVAGLPSTDEGMAETAAKLDQTTNEARRPVRPMVTHADTPNGLRPLTADDIDLLNVKELKSMLVHYGVPFKGFLEKAEFVAAAKQYLSEFD